MKKTILLTAVVLITLAGSKHCNAQWWSLTGNAGTTSSNFIGTTDNVALKIRTKNLNRMIITGGGNVGIGTTTPSYKLDVIGDARFNGVNVGRGNGNLSSNTAVGVNTLANNTSGYENTVVGNNALFQNTAGFNNSAFGFQSLFTNTSGSYNTANGYQTLFLNTTGNSNDANGHKALYNNTTGFENTATGNAALFSNTLGFNNTATGFQALYANVGSYDVEFGWSGIHNTANGYQALFNGINGSDNVAIGYKANYVGNGAQNTNVGTYAEPINAFPIFNATSIGYNSKVNNNNKVRLGDANVTVIEGQVAYSFPSDARFKNNIKENIPGLDFIKQLKPVTYNFDTKKFEEHLMQDMPESIKEERLKGRDFTASSKIIHSGFLAQDIEKTCKQLGYDFDGLHIPDAENKTDNYSVAYSQFIMPLVKAVQELSKQNDDQKNQIEELKAVVASCCKVNSSLQAKNSNSAPQASTTLYQNQPNPFNQSTVIRYTLSAEHYSGAIVIRDLSGNTVKSIAINNFGKGQVTVNANELAQGTYTYTLEIADESIDTKLMVITK